MSALAPIRLNDPNLDHTIEFSDVYDGWSVAVYKDGTMRNRWENIDAPGTAIEGYERRFAFVKAYIEVGK